MRYLLILILLLSIIFLTNIDLAHSQNNSFCITKIINNNATITMSQNYCKLSITNHSTLKVLNNSVLQANYLIISNDSQLILQNASLILIKEALIENNSKLFLYNSTIKTQNNIYNPVKITLIKSNLNLNVAKLNSKFLLINVNYYSNIASIYSTFKGLIIFNPSNYSKMSFNFSYGFYLKMNQYENNIQIYESEFALFLGINRTSSLELYVPSGYYQHWNGIIPGLNNFNIINADKIFISPINYPNIMNITRFGNLTIINSTNLEIWLNNIDYLEGLKNGLLFNSFFNSSNKFINLKNTILDKIKLFYTYLKSANIYDSTNFTIYLIDKNNINFFNDTVSSLYSFNSSITFAQNSSFVGYAQLYNQSQLYLSNSEIMNYNNLQLYGNSTVYIASLLNIGSKLVSPGGNIMLKIYGIANVISQNPNIYLSLYKLYIRILLPNASYVLISYGYSPTIGLISIYNATNMPNSYYEVRLEVLASNNVTILASKKVYIDSDIGLTIPKAPVLSYSTSSNEVILNWSSQNSPFMPISGYYILKGTSLTNMKVIYKVSYSINSYIDTNVTPGRGYYYAVVAFNIIGNSTFSNIVYVYLPSTNNSYDFLKTYNYFLEIAILFSILLLFSSFIYKKLYRK